MTMPETSIRNEAFHRVTDILRCKWTIAVLRSIEGGAYRPSEIQRENPGLSSKVLSQRLRKLNDFGLIERRVFAEVPPRVEYSLTTRGCQMASLIGSIAIFAEGWSEEIKTE